ncbi:MAG: tyrosine-type recombinase/integrase [Cyclobacteriaceae bacterium]|jgi:integrase
MNFNQTFSILFWLKKAKMNKQGLVPIWARITVDGQRAEFSTQKQIFPKFWDAENNKVNNKYSEAGQINDYLTLVKAEVIKHYNILISTKDIVSADDVKKSYKGVKEIKKTFLQLFRQFNQHLLERREVNDLSEGRHKRFQILYGKCSDFVKSKFRRTDVNLDELKLNFIVEFEHYLRAVEKIGHNTAMKYAKDLKQIMKYGVMLEYISTSPFEHFKCSIKKTKREFLDQEELDLLYKKEFNVKRLEEVRDCYVFSCYTGYAYSDAEALTVDDIAVGIDGEKWIIRNRKKTDTTENVPLLPIPREIIEKYRDHEYCKTFKKLLPMNSNQRYNAYLKEVADLCDIKKKLTTHTARHTFATTVLLLNDVPMETAMELLGHTDIRTTQIYGKIVQKKVSADMQKLKNKLSPSDIKQSNNNSE